MLCSPGLASPAHQGLQRKAACLLHEYMVFLYMKLILFYTTLALELLYTLLFVLTIKLPRFRFWPPPSHRSWQFFLAWFLAGVVAANFFLLGLLDFDSAFLHAWLRFPLALLFLAVGSALGFWSFVTFGLRATIGLGDHLVTTGPYRFSRNPQYIGDSLSIFGYMLFTNSWMAWAIGALGVLLNLLAPFTEEPWLAQRFGVAYEQYTRRVPRYIGFGHQIHTI